MIRKYRVDFELASHHHIHPYDKEGVIIEAYSAEDVLVQAPFELDEIVRRHSIVAGDKWRITKIAPVVDEAERERCAKMLEAAAESSEFGQFILRDLAVQIRSES